MIAPEIAQRVIERVFEGEAVRAICKPGSADRPCSEAAFYAFIGHPDNAEHTENYARAIVVRSDQFAEDIIEIGDGVKEDPAAIAKARLKIDARKWLMSKLAPKKYGDRQAVELTGKDGGPIETKVYDASIAGRAGALEGLLNTARARESGAADSDTAKPT